MTPTTPDGPPTVRFPTDVATPPPKDRLSGHGLAFRFDPPDEPDDPPAPRLPSVGDTFLGFELVEELGHGTFASVYLARQAALAGRPVALKVTSRPAREAQKLARLQHANVVPVYSVHDAPPVQGLCMPYLGRRTLADPLRAFRRDHPSRARSGKRRSATDEGGPTLALGSGSGSAVRPPATRPALPIADDGAELVGDVPAVLRILAGLAAGLAHAHSRGVLHLDIKPANVLLADTGEPMLLDFNLAHDTTAPGRDLVGGTVQYMAPEQLRDVRTGGHGGVDARTDLYSLGVLAFELLTGEVPFPASSRLLTDFDQLVASRGRSLPRARDLNPAVTPAVDAILQKLMAPHPADRYQSAEELKTDLDRHLADRPLQFTREPSVKERFGKWRRRNPGLAVRLAAAVLAVAAVGTGVAAARQSAARAEAQAAVQADRTRAALHSVRLDLILGGEPAAREKGRTRAAELLAAYGLLDDPDWRKREAFAHAPAGDRDELAGDLGELLLLLAHSRWRDAPAEGDARRAAAADALRLTKLARDCFPPGEGPPLLTRQLAELATLTGEPAPPAEPQTDRPRTARDEFLDAAADLACGRYAAAADRLEAAVAARPGHAAAQFALALCRQQLGHHARAVERFDVARVLLPNDPRPCYYRGLVFGQMQKHDLAEADFTRAAAIDPAHADSFRDRAVARIGRRKFAEAEADLTRALELGAAPMQVYLLRAQAREKLGNKAGADADRKAAATHQPAREADYLVRGWTRMKADPAAALADFRAVTALNPRSLPALQNQVHVLADGLKDLPASLEVANRVVELFPEHAPARAGRAVILARMGKRAEAHAEAEKARQLADEPRVAYTAACVYARTAATDPADAAKALALLRQALRDGSRDPAQLDADPDLDPIRKLPEFAAIVRAARELAR